MARKKDEGGMGTGSRLTPVDVQQVQFKRALRGYDEQEVDDFLDRITEELTLLVDERRAASERAGSLPTVRVASAGDAAAASKEAEELVRQAREHADQIVREANQRAAATVRDAEARAAATGAAVGAAAGSAAGGTAAGGTGGVAVFVAKEREFLQRLAALVQGHAEGVKAMVASAREPAATGAGSPASASPAAGAAVSPVAPAAPIAAPGTAPGSTAPGGSTSGGSGPSTGQPGPSGAPGPSAGAASAGTAASAPAPTGSSPQGQPTAVATATMVSGTREEPVPRIESPEPSPASAAAAPRVIDLSDPASDPPRTVETAAVAERAVPPATAAAPDRDAGVGAGDDSTLRALFWGEE